MSIYQFDLALIASAAKGKVNSMFDSIVGVAILYALLYLIQTSSPFIKRRFFQISRPALGQLHEIFRHHLVPSGRFRVFCTQPLLLLC